MAKKTWVAYRRGEAEGVWEVRIVSRIRAVRQMQERMAKYRKPGESVVEELLRDRRPRLNSELVPAGILDLPLPLQGCEWHRTA